MELTCKYELMGNNRTQLLYNLGNDKSNDVGAATPSDHLGWRLQHFATVAGSEIDVCGSGTDVLILSPPDALR